MAGEDKEQQHVEHAALWIDRARKDYAAFKLLTGFRPRFSWPNIFGRLGRTTSHCGDSTDAALSIYLLQQCVEKTVKALAIGSGQYDSVDVKKEYGHDSKALLLDFWDRLEGVKGNQQHSSVLSDITESPHTSDDDLSVMLQLLKRVYDKSLFPVDKIPLEPGDTVHLSFRVVIEGVERELSVHYRSQSSVPEEFELSNLALKAFLDLGDVFHDAADRISRAKGKNVYTHGAVETWSLGCLLILAALTVGHEATSRYPRTCQKKANNQDQMDLGCQDCSLVDIQRAVPWSMVLSRLGASRMRNPLQLLWRG